MSELLNTNELAKFKKFNDSNLSYNLTYLDSLAKISENFYSNLN